MGKVVSFIKKEIVLVLAGILAVITCFFIAPNAMYVKYIDFKVLSLLFCLMTIVCGLTNIKAFDAISAKLLLRCKNARILAAVLIGLCFFLSMFITNDVALITFVPLTLITLKKSNLTKYSIIVIVLQTIAANLGSSLTPIGNPQNLFIYSLFNLNIIEFLSITLPIIIFGIVILFGSLYFIPKTKIELSLEEGGIKLNKVYKLIIFIAVFIVCMLTVLGVLHYLISLAVTLLCFIIFDRKVFKKIDYLLLVTFIFFFIFIGNFTRIYVVKNFMTTIVKGNEFFISIIFSQIISNVPTAVMISAFTTNYTALLLGVNMGGLGTIIASLASLISYKIYAKSEGAKKGKYLGIFSLFNFAILILGSLMCSIILLI